MKWAVLTVAILAGIVIVIAIVGAALPRDHVAAMSARIGAPPSDVWTAITTPAGFPQWRPDVKSVDIVASPAGALSWREHSKNGAITMVAVASQPPERFVTRIADTGLPFGGEWEYRIAPSGAHESIVTITERGSVYNPIFRFVSRFVMGHTATINTYLRALGKRFGGDVTPTAVALGENTHGL